MASKLTLIDLSSIWWQNWHASTDMEIGSAYEGTLKKVYAHVNNDDPVAICIDAPPYRRKNISADYKAQRDKPSAVALDQLQRVKDKLSADGFPMMESPGYEADDIIATLVRKTIGRAEGSPITETQIVSSDKDLLQLVQDDPIVYATSPLTGEEFGPSEVFAKFGVNPWQLGDLLALMGDKSDNVPGVKGVGVKTAAALIQEHKYSGLIQLLKCADPIPTITPPGIRQKLLDNFSDLKMSRQLVELEFDAPLENWESIFASRVPKAVEESMSYDEDALSEEVEDVEVVEAAEPPTAIAKVESGNWNMALEPRNSGGAWELSKILFDSHLYVQFSNAQAILAVILRGRSLGMDATTSLDGFHVIKGKPTMSAVLMVGLVLQSDVCDYFKCAYTDEHIATYKTHRAGDPDPDATEYSYTMEMAKKALLAGKKTRSGDPSQWDKMPGTMLRWRCATELARMVYPDVVGGLYSPDEMSNGEVIDAEVIK